MIIPQYIVTTVGIPSLSQARLEGGINFIASEMQVRLVAFIPAPTATRAGFAIYEKLVEPVAPPTPPIPQSVFS